MAADAVFVQLSHPDAGGACVFRIEVAKRLKSADTKSENSLPVRKRFTIFAKNAKNHVLP